MALITTDDLDPFANIEPTKSQAMIDDATAVAMVEAPCLADEGSLTEVQKAAAKAILRGAILRWNEAGNGALSQQVAGPFQQTIDNRSPRKSMFWPLEIEQLKGICSSGDGSGGAFSVDTAPACGLQHADICSVNFGADYCSCGAYLTGMFALYERQGC